MKRPFIIILAILSIITWYSCRGDQQEKLVGVWEQISFYEPDSLNSTIWKFYAGDKLVIIKKSPNKQDSIIYSYGISGSQFDVLEGVDNPNYEPAARDPRGEYWIDNLSNDQFKATKRYHPDGTSDGVYMRIELVKR